MNHETDYRADIDGLRAGAVLLVIGYHFFPSRFPGGYVGVDIFFVISGFLITGILLQDLERQDFSIARFYGRRIRRIFPALLAVLAASFVAGWVLLLPGEFRSLGLNVFGGATFSSNFVLLGETGYFGLQAIQKPLLHLWSLGVEEQFYIAWPLLLFVFLSMRVSILAVAAGLFLVSFALNVAVSGTAADFFLPLTRAWELMVGGMLAVTAGRSTSLGVERLRASIRSAASWTKSGIVARDDVYAFIGVTLIVIAVAGLNHNSAFPGWWALLPTSGTAFIVSANGSWLNRIALSHPATVWIGLISYPLYLWHWPLLSFLSFTDPTPSWLTRDVLIVLAILLAWLTYIWIEQPIRRGKPLPLKIFALCAAMLIVGSAGFVVFQAKGVPSRIPTNIREIAALDPLADPDKFSQFKIKEWRALSCFLDSPDKLQFAAECLEQGRRPLVFLWGDSMAASLYPGLKDLQRQRPFGLAQYTSGECPPAFGYVSPLPMRSHCAEYNDFAFSVLSSAHPDIVLLHSTWSPNYGDFMPGLRVLVEKLRALNVPRIIIMGLPPTWEGGLPNAAYRYYMSTREMIPARSDFHVSDAVHRYEERFRQQIMPLGTEYISAWDALCDADKCVTRVGDDAADLVAFDGSHLTVAGSILMAKTIAPCLFSEAPADLAQPETPVQRSAVCARPSGPAR
jgi:peptidoglycan/LPS O-acetylase OafA/YrhL